MAMAMPSRWRGCRLSRSEGALLADLVQRGDQGSRYTRLTLVVRGFTGIDRDRDASLKVTMCRLRGKLALLDPPVRIGTEWGAGYRIDAENLALLAERRI
jgi:DNA-binding response OmpR family regulator